MGDFVTLMLVILILYIVECVGWARGGVVIFSTRLGAFYRAKKSGLGLMLKDLLPLGVYLRIPPATVMSPAGVCLTEHQGHIFSAHPSARRRFLPFEDLDPPVARNRHILIGEKSVLAADSDADAAELVRRMISLRSQPTEQRERAIADSIQNSFNVPEIEKRTRSFYASTRILSMLCHILFIDLFFILPLFFIQPLFNLHLPIGLPNFLAIGIFSAVLLLLIAAAFYRAHSTLYPESADERIFHTLHLLIYPIAAIRARDLLSTRLLDGFHPIAVAKVLLPEREFETASIQMVREWMYPSVNPSDGETLDGRECQTWFDESVRKSLFEWMRKSGTDITNILKDPDPENDRSTSYCPRCLAQYVIRTGICGDCRTNLVRFSNR